MNLTELTERLSDELQSTFTVVGEGMLANVFHDKHDIERVSFLVQSLMPNYTAEFMLAQTLGKSGQFPGIYYIRAVPNDENVSNDSCKEEMH